MNKYIEPIPECCKYCNHIRLGIYYFYVCNVDKHASDDEDFLFKKCPLKKENK